MKLTEIRLRDIIREELSKLTENEDALAQAVKKASQQVIDIEDLGVYVGGDMTTNKGQTVVFIKNRGEGFGLEINVNERSIEIGSDPGVNTGAMNPDEIRVDSPQDITRGGSKFTEFFNSFMDQLRVARRGY